MAQSQLVLDFQNALFPEHKSCLLIRLESIFDFPVGRDPAGCELLWMGT
jgi:hypothetical protein